MRYVAFVLPFVFETSQRFLRAALAIPGLRVGVISGEPLERLGPETARRLAGHWKVKNPLDPAELVRATRGLERQMGRRVERLIGVLEQAQVPLAIARQELELPGLKPETALNFRDKARMKDVLRQAGVPCARHALATSPAAVKAFVAEVGLPVVVKPQAGAGAKNTFRLDRESQVGEALRAFPPSAQRPMFLEEFIVGEEHSFDAVTLGGETVWASVSRYRPTPLEVLQNDWIQWTVLLPRDVSGELYAPIRTAGTAALRALGMDRGLSHMEWFRRRDGSVAISEVGARPPGAQITSLLSYAYDANMYQAWARLVCGGGFDAPQRKFAAGAAYLRGMGRGDRVVGIHGLERAQREVGDLVVEVQLPRPGQPRANSYEGDGYVLVRHPETQAVEAALKRIVELIRVEVGG